MGLNDPDFDPMAPPRHASRALVRFSAIGEAWAWFQAAWFTWVLAMFVVFVGNSIVSKVIDSFFHLGRPSGVIGYRWPMPRSELAIQLIVAALINGFFVGGMLRMASRQLRGERIRVADLFSVVDVLAELALGSMLYAIIVAIASSFCFLPGVLLHGLLMMTLPLIVNSGLTATQAMRGSWNALKGQWLTASLFHLAVSFISGLGALFCGIGILFTGPLYALSLTVLYRDLFVAKRAQPRGKPAPSYDADF